MCQAKRIRFYCKKENPLHDFRRTPSLFQLSIGNLKVEVGKVNFVSFWKTTEFYIIIGSVCGGILVVLVIIVSVLICLRRRKQQEKPINGIEMTPGMFSLVCHDIHLRRYGKIHVYGIFQKVKL